MRSRLVLHVMCRLLETSGHDGGAEKDGEDSLPDVDFDIDGSTDVGLDRRGRSRSRRAAVA